MHDPNRPVIEHLERRLGDGDISLVLNGTAWFIEHGIHPIASGTTTASQTSLIITIEELHSVVAWAERHAAEEAALLSTPCP